jgi:hypothetical protein
MQCSRRIGDTLSGHLTSFAVALALLQGCTVDPSPADRVTGAALSSRGDSVMMRCVEGCLEPDPDSTAPGYFLPGLENQWTHCADGDVDGDLDGLDDGCEFTLALTFRPELSIVYFDYASREPRWAAEWLNSDAATRTVRIAYLLGYWIDPGDGGTSGILCGLNPLGNPCKGHIGDSEWIRLDVTYDEASQHWYLADAKYSAHTWHVDFDRHTKSGWLYVSSSSDGGGPIWYPRNYMEYPDGKIGGGPRAYVADNKHANYPTDSYCDGPGGLGAQMTARHRGFWNEWPFRSTVTSAAATSRSSTASRPSELIIRITHWDSASATGTTRPCSTAGFSPAPARAALQHMGRSLPITSPSEAKDAHPS